MLFMLVWSLGGASWSVRDALLRFGIRWHRRQRYASVRQMDDHVEEEADGDAVTLEMAVRTPDRSRNSTVLKRKGSNQQTRLNVPGT